MALSMVVVASMIGAGGLGEYVLSGIQRLDIGIGFEGGLGVVLLAIILDRITESFGVKSAKKRTKAKVQISKGSAGDAKETVQT
jgi:glycine betaine/proline transport system permease protein